MNVQSSDFDIPQAESTDFEVGADQQGRWIDRLSVVKKLYLAVFGNTAVLALVAVVMLAGTIYLGELGKAQAIITSVEVRSNNAAISLVSAVDSLEASEQTNSSTQLASASASLDEAYEILTDPIEFAGDDMPADLGPIVHGFRDRVSALQAEIALAQAGSPQVAELRAETKQLYSDLSTFAVELHTVAAAKGDRLFASLSQFLLGFIIMVIVGVIVSLVAARQVINNVANAIRAITASMQNVASGDTNSTIPGRERSDEIGAMARALAVFRTDSLKLRDLNVERVQAAESELAQQQEMAEQARKAQDEKGELLESLADGFEVTVGEMISAVGSASAQLRSTSVGLVGLADQSSDQSRNALAAMETTNRNVTAAAAATDEFALSISEISKQASDSAVLARQSNELVGAANAKMAELATAADEIGEIAELIQTIAQRTNLLALNASIEAARGGEAGRGFAVVASEVKELAHQTSQATSSVTEKITAMQSSTQSSVVDLTSIVEQIDKLEQAAVVIATAVDQQSISGEDLARNIDTVASGSSDVASQIEQLHAAAEATGSASNEVLSSATSLDGHSEALRAKATQFLTDIRNSSRNLGLVQKKG